jgi:hypothetical protein
MGQLVVLSCQPRFQKKNVNEQISLVLLILIKPFDGGLTQPLAKAPGGGVFSFIKTMALEWETAPSW